MNKKKDISVRIKKLTAIAMFSAMAYVCVYFLRIPVQFLTLDIKDSLIVLCALLFGPIAGAVVAIMVPLLELITISDTGAYGLIMNILSSLSFSVTASVIYRYKKSMMGAVVGLLSGVFVVTAIMMVANLLITPYYMGVPTGMVVSLIPKLLLPFNLIKAVLNASIVLLLYKPLSKLMKKTGFVQVTATSEAQGTPKEKSHLRSVLITLVSVLLIVGSLAIIFLVLRK